MHRITVEDEYIKQLQKLFGADMFALEIGSTKQVFDKMAQQQEKLFKSRPTFNITVNEHLRVPLTKFREDQKKFKKEVILGFGILVSHFLG